MDNHGALRKRYKLRFNVRGKNSLLVAFPFEVAEREARERNLTIEELLENFQLVAQYDGFDGVHYNFEEMRSEGKESE